MIERMLGEVRLTGLESP